MLYQQKEQIRKNIQHLPFTLSWSKGSWRPSNVSFHPSGHPGTGEMQWDAQCTGQGPVRARNRGATSHHYRGNIKNLGVGFEGVQASQISCFALLVGNTGLIPRISKWGPQIISITITWECVRNANCQAPSQTYYIRNAGKRGSSLYFNQDFGDSDACSSLRIIRLICRRKSCFSAIQSTSLKFFIRVGMS